MVTKEYWIEKLKLLSHPEGGYYKEVYRSEGEIQADSLPNKYEGARNYATSIYFLLGHDDISSFHRLKSDELWYYHDGEPLHVYIIENGTLRIEKLGLNIDEGEQLQVIIPAGSIFGAKVISNKNFTLMGCAVAPGFDFKDFELLDRKTLLDLYPQHEEVIKMLTK
jgi:predicted cupin superfamily sugar epimerase